MAPEVLIVGDPTLRSELLSRVTRLGYEAALCSAATLGQRMESGAGPAAVVVCTEDVEPRALMTQLRQMHHGSGVPVTLHGPLGSNIGDLADVLDLGADHFLESPATDDQLHAALDELVGPTSRHPSRPTLVPAAGATASVPTPPATDTSAADSVLGQLHRTLDMLEDRLRKREQSDGDDDIDLASLGFEALPDVGSATSPSEPSVSSLELSRAQPGPARADGRSIGRRIRTERLGQRTSSVSVGVDGRDGEVSRARPRPVALPVGNEGTLDQIAVPKLLWVLHRAGFYGALTLRSGRTEKRLWWRQGVLSFVESNVGGDRLVDGLLRRGLLTQPQYEDARRATDPEPRRAAARLLQGGFLKESEAPRVVRQHLCAVVTSTFTWAEGEYTVHADERCEGRGLEAVPVARILAQGIRDRLEGAQLTTLLGGVDGHPRFLGDNSEAQELSRTLLLSPSELSWVERLDGRQSTRELLAAPQADERELLPLVYLLLTIERLSLEVPAKAEGPVADPRAIDTNRIGHRLELARAGDYFATLNLPIDACRIDVQRAHTELHQTFADDALEPEVRASMKADLAELRDLLDEARDVLSDESLRSAYLAHMENA